MRRFDGILRFCRQAQVLIREAAYLCDLVNAHAIFLHDATGSIGAIGRQFPVRVARVVVRN